MTANQRPPLILYDGLCGLCDRLVQFLLRRDREDRFRFAPLQSRLARETLDPHGVDAAELNTVCVVADFRTPGETVLTKSSAVLYALAQLGGLWRLAVVLRGVPRAVADPVYDFIARHRYRIFGKREACYLPDERDCRKFEV